MKKKFDAVKFQRKIREKLSDIAKHIRFSIREPVNKKGFHLDFSKNRSFLL